LFRDEACRSAPNLFPALSVAWERYQEQAHCKSVVIYNEMLHCGGAGRWARAKAAIDNLEQLPAVLDKLQVD
jgi:hypothetical protein